MYTNNYTHTHIYSFTSTHTHTPHTHTQVYVLWSKNSLQVAASGTGKLIIWQGRGPGADQLFFLRGIRTFDAKSIYFLDAKHFFRRPFTQHFHLRLFFLRCVLSHFSFACPISRLFLEGTRGFMRSERCRSFGCERGSWATPQKNGNTKNRFLNNKAYKTLTCKYWAA